MAGGQAVEAPRATTFLIEPEELQVITDEKHPLYDPRERLPIDEAMVASIMEFGVITPIAAVKDGDNIVVVDGRQRVKNAVEANRRLKAAGRELVRIQTVLKKAPEQALFGMMLVTNELRQDDPPLARAEKVSRYIAMGRSEAQAAVAMGLKTSEVKQLLSLLDCARPVQKAVEAGSLSLSAAASLAKLTRDEQASKLEGLLADAASKPTGKKKGKVTVREAQRAAGKADNRPSRRTMEALLESGLLTNLERDVLSWVLTGEALGLMRAHLDAIEKKKTDEAA